MKYAFLSRFLLNLNTVQNMLFTELFGLFPDLINTLVLIAKYIFVATLPARCIAMPEPANLANLESQILPLKSYRPGNMHCPLIPDLQWHWPWIGLCGYSYWQNRMMEMGYFDGQATILL